MTEVAAEARPAEVAGALRAVISRLNRMLRQQNVGELTLSQWSALVTLDGNGPMRIGELAEREHVSAPTATRLVAVLESAALVARAPDTADRRSAVISLTDAGAAAVRQARRLRTARLARLVSGLQPADLQRLVDALPVLDRLTRDADSGH